MLRKLEKYEILEEIGHGGMATVYRAQDTVLDRPVALKVMHPHLRAAEEARRRFHREARSVARLKHPRVLEIYDFSGEGSEEAYIAAELLTGPTLKQWREKQKEVSAEIAACFVIEIAHALEHAHSHGIVHRDVKPENVLLHENRTIKLTDFGIADMIDAQSMTATGQILGSPGHMAPEQIEGKDSDPRTDLFSLGTVLYYLATGRLPFTGRNPHQVLKRIIDGEYADPLRVNPTIGGRLRAIIVKSLERDANERYQSARELIDDLTAFVAEAGIDDSEKALERYLHDPEGVGEEVRKATVGRLIDLGARASDAGDVPRALDYYNRVLALDEGNERVLKLIERVGVDRRRRMMMAIGVSLIAVGAVSALGAWALWPEDRPTELEVEVVGAIDAGAAFDAALAQRVAVDAGAADAAIASSAPDAGAPVVVARTRDAARRASPASNEPRVVELHPIPANVSISIDGDAPVPFGPARERVPLTPGRHEVRVIPNADAESNRSYRTHTFDVVVPPGSGEHRAILRLPFAPSAVFVESNIEGTVDVAGRRGPTGELLTIPMSSERANYRLRVTAPNHQPHEQWITLEAGSTHRQGVSLSPAPRAQAP